MWKWASLFLRKNHLLRCCVWLSLLNWIGALILSLLLKLPPGKYHPWFVLWHFFLLRLLCISINLPYCHAWNTAVMSGLVLLTVNWNCQISNKNRCWSLTFYLSWTLTSLSNITSLNLIYRYCSGRCSSELVELVPLHYSWGRSTHYYDRLYDFSVTIPNVTRMPMLTVSFLAQLYSLEFLVYRMVSFH